MVSIFKEAVKDALYPNKDGVLSTRNKSFIVHPAEEMSAKEIKKLRNSLHLSTAYFATILAVNIKTVQSWESGENSPSGPALRMLNMLKKNPDFLLDMKIVEETFV